MKLFATDLDGTLLDREGRVRPEDKEAIRAARARGVKVTIATGRLTRCEPLRPPRRTPRSPCWNGA